MEIKRNINAQQGKRHKHTSVSKNCLYREFCDKHTARCQRQGKDKVTRLSHTYLITEVALES